MSQFQSLAVAHYTALVITWPDGATQRVTIDEDFRHPSQG
jgi:hypothetical protein